MALLHGISATATATATTRAAPVLKTRAVPARRSHRTSAIVVKAEAEAESAHQKQINLSIRKDEPKVVDQVSVQELSKPTTAYCRCWKSGTFPLCDGTHAKHNKETGDNVGPLLLKK